MINGFTNSQQRRIHRMHRQGYALDRIAAEWDATVEEVKAVIAHRDSVDERNGVIRLG